MELKLKQEVLTYLEAVAEAPFSFETTQEAIIPDSCADAERIIDTGGVVLLHSRELLADGRLELSGVIRASVLFVPEGTKEVSALHLSIPMHAYCDGKHLASCETFTVSARLKSIDSRLLNPRKLLTRAETTVELCGYERKSMLLATDAAAQEGLETLYDTGETTVTTTLTEREFSFVDELAVSTARPEIKEILSGFTELKSADCRILGSKLVIKGIAQIRLLCKDTAGAVSTLYQECMFSHITETDGSEETSRVHCAFDLTGCEYQIGTEGRRDDGHSVTVKLHIRSRIHMTEKRSIVFLADMYSVFHPLKLDRQTVELHDETQTAVKKQSLRELIPTATEIRDVISATVSCGSCRSCSGEQGSFVEVPIRLRCLCLDEHETLLCAEKEITVKAETELNCLDCPSITVENAGEISAAPAPDGIETRFALEFHITTKRVREKTAVVSALEEEENSFSAQMPSLVLRKFERGERLWDIAKQYRTTTAAILAANGLENERTVGEEQLLLIPRHK